MGFLLFIPAIVLVVAGVVSAGTGVGGVAIALGVLWGIIVVIVMTALTGIYQTALYHFAVAGHVPSGYFDNRVMGSAFHTRRSRRRR